MCYATPGTGSYCKNAAAGGLSEQTGRIAEHGDLEREGGRGQERAGGERSV